MPLLFRPAAFAAAVCIAVFLASVAVARPRRRGPDAGVTAMLLLRQFLTWLGLRWVWRGFRRP